MIRQEIVTVSFFPHSQNMVRMMEIVIETNWWWEYFACQDLFINLCIDDNSRNHGKWCTFYHRERKILPYVGQFWLFCREFTNCLTYFLWAAEYQNWQIKGMNLWWVWSWEYDEPFSSGLGRINGRSGKTTSVGVCLSTWLLTLFDAGGGVGEKRNGIWVSWSSERFFWHSSEVSWRRSKRMKWKGIRVEILHNF